MSNTNRDPGAPLDSEGIPDYADDASPERTNVPEPQRLSTPTEEPAASTDFGTTAEEQRSGESLDHKLEREVGEDPGSTRPGQEDQSPYEREIPPAESDLAVHETLPGQIDEAGADAGAAGADAAGADAGAAGDVDRLGEPP
jgi:hypothetical protein